KPNPTITPPQRKSTFQPNDIPSDVTCSPKPAQTMSAPRTTKSQPSGSRRSKKLMNLSPENDVQDQNQDENENPEHERPLIPNRFLLHDARSKRPDQPTQLGVGFFPC